DARRVTDAPRGADLHPGRQAARDVLAGRPARLHGSRPSRGLGLMRTSTARPQGHPNDWPLDDKKAFVALVTATYSRTGRSKSEVVPAHESARQIGLDGGEHRWMCDELLSGC